VVTCDSTTVNRQESGSRHASLEQLDTDNNEKNDGQKTQKTSFS
jgi:hypothetical protein